MAVFCGKCGTKLPSRKLRTFIAVGFGAWLLAGAAYLTMYPKYSLGGPDFQVQLRDFGEQDAAAILTANMGDVFSAKAWENTPRTGEDDAKADAVMSAVTTNMGSKVIVVTLAGPDLTLTRAIINGRTNEQFCDFAVSKSLKTGDSFKIPAREGKCGDDVMNVEFYTDAGDVTYTFSH
jgi:hypothetical protein